MGPICYSVLPWEVIKTNKPVPAMCQAKGSDIVHSSGALGWSSRIQALSLGQQVACLCMCGRAGGKRMHLLLCSPAVIFDSFATLKDCSPSLSMGFSGQKYWRRLQFPFSGDLPNPGIPSTSPALAGRLFSTEPPLKPSLTGCRVEHYMIILNVSVLIVIR